MVKKETTYFWTVQLSGWMIMGFINYLLHTLAKPPPLIEFLNTFSITIGGILFTSLYRMYLKKNINWVNYKNARLAGFVFLSTIVVTFCWFFFIVLIFIPFMGTYHISFVSFIPSLFNLYILVLMWTLLYLGFNLVKKYHLSEVEKWQLEAEMQKAKLGSLRSQINPHFIFNTLNNIRALILEDGEAARRMITGFSELFRYSLQYTELKEVTVEEEIDILNRYIEICKVQYEDKLHFELHADDEARQDKVPPMILQLLAENAVKHGLALSVTGGEIIVRIQKQLNMLRLEVKNTGSLYVNNQLEKSSGVGIKNIQERLRLLYGNRASLVMGEDKPYVTVVIKIILHDQGNYR